MTRNIRAHRAEFSVRCACGMVYNTSDQHIGRKLQCKCGRTVTVVRPVESHHDTPKGSPTTKTRSGRWQRSTTKPAYRVAGSRVLRRVRQRALATVWWAWRQCRDAWMATTSRRPLRRWTARLSWAWLAGMALTAMLLITTSESFLPMTLLAYGPRFVLLLPLVPLGIAALVFSRMSLLPLAAALLVILGPIMGGRLSWRSLGRGLPAVATPGGVRVMTFNTEGGRLVAPRLRETVATVQPDLIALQECGDVLWDSLRVLPQYHTSRNANLCTGSRWPMERVDSMPRSDFARIATYGFGGTGLVYRFTLSTPHGPLVFVNLHLETARKGLESLSGEDGFVPDHLRFGDAKSIGPGNDALSRIDINAQIRERESERASVWSAQGDRSVPLLIAGDFNLPVESAIFRRHWGGFTDAFERAGTGLGWSKREGRLLRIRIDHILGNATAPKPAGTWLGPNLGSDHLPVIADLVWPAR